MKITTRNSLFLFLLSFVISPHSAHTIRISTPEDYAALVANVNSGAAHAGTTVYLAGDLDLSSLGATDPIGKSPDTPFLGTIDGQGHVIRNLTINSTQASVGMIAFADGHGENGENGGGAAVRNLVLDAASTVRGTCTAAVAETAPLPYWRFLGAVLGSCTASGRPCRVDGCVNMARVVLAGSDNSSAAAAVGGMVGGCQGGAYGCVVANCVNYGTVASLGPFSAAASYVGGMVGLLRSDRSANTGAETCVRGCFNYGPLVDSSAPAECLCVGGIVGAGYGGVSVYGCVGAGPYANETLPESGAAEIGGIAGRLADGGNVAYGFWRNDVWGGAVGSFGTGSAPISVSRGFEFSSLLLEKEEGDISGTDVSLWDALSGIADTVDLYRIEYALNGGEFELSLPSPLIVSAALALPDPVKWGAAFCGWFADPELTEPADFSVMNVSGEVALYAQWTHTISFETDNGETFQPITSAPGEVVVLPNASSSCGRTFVGWRAESPAAISDPSFYDGGSRFTAPGHWVTFVALFEPNDYFLDFYSWDGSLVEGSVRVKFGATVNSSYFPEWNKTKGDFVFDGWVLDSSEKSELLDAYTRDKSFPMPCHNITLTAQLISDTVKIVFTSVMTNNDVNVFVDRIYTKRLNTYDIVEIGEEEVVLEREGEGEEKREPKSYAVILFETRPAARKFYNAMGKWVIRGHLSYYSYEPHFVEVFSEASLSATILPPPCLHLHLRLLPLPLFLIVFIHVIMPSFLPSSLSSHSR